MQVRMLTGLAGVEFSRAPGDLHECSDEEGERLIAAGFAEAVGASAPATTPAAVKSAGKKKG